MVTTYAQTYLAVDFKAAGRGEEAEHRRAERVGWREDYATMVGTLAIGCGGRALEGEMPFEEIRFQGSGVQGGIWVSSKLLGFLEDAFYGWRLGIECRGGHSARCFELETKY